MNDIRPIDYSGHMPDPEPGKFAGRSADYQLGYQQAILDLTCELARQAQAELTAVLERLNAA